MRLRQEEEKEAQRKQELEAQNQNLKQTVQTQIRNFKAEILESLQQDKYDHNSFKERQLNDQINSNSANI